MKSAIGESLVQARWLLVLLIVPLGVARGQEPNSSGEESSVARVNDTTRVEEALKTLPKEAQEPRPRVQDMFINVPGDWVSAGSVVVESQTLPYIAGVGVMTGRLDNGSIAQYFEKPGEVADLMAEADRLKITDRVTFAGIPVVGLRFWSVLDVYCQTSLVPSVGSTLATALAFTACQQGRRIDGDLAGEAVELTEVDDDDLLAEDVLEALLGQPARKRHLAPLVARPGVVPRAGLEALVPLRGGPAVAGTVAAADPLSLFPRALGGP